MLAAKNQEMQSNKLASGFSTRHPRYSTYASAPSSLPNGAKSLTQSQKNSSRISSFARGWRCDGSFQGIVIVVFQ